MRYALAFAGLVVMAVAAPIEMGTDRSYGTYDPYKNYGTYSVAVGVEAANMQRGMNIWIPGSQFDTDDPQPRPTRSALQLLP